MFRSIQTFLEILRHHGMPCCMRAHPFKCKVSCGCLTKPVVRSNGVWGGPFLLNNALGQNEEWGSVLLNGWKFTNALWGWKYFGLLRVRYLPCDFTDNENPKFQILTSFSGASATKKYSNTSANKYCIAVLKLGFCPLWFPRQVSSSACFCSSLIVVIAGSYLALLKSMNHA